MRAFRTGVHTSLPIALVTTNMIGKHIRISLLRQYSHISIPSKVKRRSAPCSPRRSTGSPAAHEVPLISCPVRRKPDESVRAVWCPHHKVMIMSTEMHATDVKGLVEHLQQALNGHDIEAYLACFHETYASDQPAHPARSFRGREQVRKNWTAIFDGVPDFQAEVLRWAAAVDMVWIEWRW